MRLPLLALALLAVAGPVRAAAWTLTNHAGDCENSLVRLDLAVPQGFAPGQYVVTEDGTPVPYQVSPDGVWVATTMASGTSHTYEIAAGTPPETAPLVTGTREGDDAVVLDNGLVAVRVVAREGSGPIAGVRAEGGPWVGSSAWRTDRKVTAVALEVPGAGPLYGKAIVRTTFAGTGGTFGDEAAFSEVAVTLRPGQRLVHVQESHAMGPDDAWTFEAADRWSPTKGLMRRWHRAPFKGAAEMEEVPLVAGQTRLGTTLLNLQPRWTQSFDEGWFFGATDGTRLVGAIPARAGRWEWGHDNLIRVKLPEDGGRASLQCPTWRGRRYWLLLAGPRALADEAKGVVTRAAFQTLNKLTHEYILEWPGIEPGGFRGDFFYSSGTNPTGGRRGMGRNAMSSAGRGKASRATLSRVQVNLDPDWYCGYWQKWSPINPNFYTDFIKYPVGEACNLKTHPRFETLAARAEDAVRTDLHFSVTLPGGAGQECPGYLQHAMTTWQEFARVGREHLGFDVTAWPQYRAAAYFLAHVAQPVGPGRYAFHPGGDTHPNRPDPMAFAREFGVRVDPKTLATEELPGFGVVFRNRAATDRETYLAFKSGPNRGHYHGDQLSFHYCAKARPVAVDHHCSYKPRPGQEHMHNRVAFHTDSWPYANMDGYERVIAFRTDDPEVDVAVGQVESRRLRKQLKLPPEEWDAHGPYRHFNETLTYRRTVVLVTGRDEDYFVIRDQYTGPELTAVYALHVLANRVERQGPTVTWPNLTLFCAAPAAFEFERFPWEHRAGGGEHTEGVRLSVKGAETEFITVLHPSSKPPAMKAVERGVEIDFGGGKVDRVTFPEGGEAVAVFARDGASRTILARGDIDLERSQGEVGLFVPDCGYDFGPMPDWLLRQRLGVPDWHRPWPFAPLP